MERLEFIKENWYADENVPPKSTTRLVLSDFRGEEKECWHLRGRGWRWVTLRSNFSGLKNGQAYVLSFWAKFDYYSGIGTRCFIVFHKEEDWDNRITFDINPNSPNAVAKSGDWFLYQFPFTFKYDNTLRAEIVAFEANIAIMPANPEDEKNSLITTIQDQNKGIPYRMDQELPFKEYTYLEQRIVKFYSDLLAPYYPSREIPEVSQSEYYDFVKGLYDKLFRKSEEFFTKLYEDDAHPARFNNKIYGKPELNIHIKKDRAKIEELFQLLLILWSAGEVTEDGLRIEAEISKRQKTMLSYMGFEVSDGLLKHRVYTDINPAIKYLTEKEKPLWSLMYCWFDSTYPYLEKTHEKFYDREQYHRLTNWLDENGYLTCIASGNEITLDYYKGIGKKDSPVGYAIHGDKFHYGFTFEYRPGSRVMQHCELRIIQFTEMLKHFDILSENTKKLILRRTKPCDGCRYCIQTDKTGKRPLAAIKLIDGTKRCPYYPGFNFTFEILNKQDVDFIISFLTDLESKIIRNN